MIVWLPAEGFGIQGCRLRGVSAGFGFSLELCDGVPLSLAEPLGVSRCRKGG